MNLLFFFLIYSQCEEDSGTGIIYNWDGQTNEPKLYLETSDGNLYLIDILKRKILWKVDTGGDVCASTSRGRTTYIPSIDGYLFTYTPEYGFQRLAMSIRELVFTAPFRTRSGEIFSSGKRSTIFEINPEDGSVLSIQSSNSSTPILPSKVKEDEIELISSQNHITIIRIDYDLSVYNGDSQFVRYSEFEIFSYERDDNEDENSHTLFNVNVETQIEGLVTIYINDTEQFQLSFPALVTGVFGSEGKFKYQILSDDSESDAVFLTNNSLVFTNRPILPSSPEADNETANENTEGAITENNNENSTELEDFSKGFHKIQPGYVPYEKITNLPKQQNKTEQDSDDTDRAENMPESDNIAITVSPVYFSFTPYNFITIAIILGLLYFGLRVVLFLVARLMKVERKLVPIIVDSKDPTKGISGGRRLTLVHRRRIDMKSLTLARRVGLLDNTAKFLKDEIRENETIIGYQQLEPFDFQHMDAVQFLTRILGALKSIFSVGLVHGSISEEVIYSDGGKATLAGLEWSCSRTFSTEKRAKDIKDTAMIVIRSFNHFEIPFEPLLQDLLSEMKNDDPMERPTPDEALSHPLFWTIKEKTKIYYYVNDELSSQSVPPILIQAFEDHRIQVLQCTSWLATLPKPLINDIKSRGDYGGDSMRDLVRMIRNKIEHFSETPDKLIAIMGSTPDDVFRYFDQKFPNLFLYTYYFYQKYCT